MTENEYMEIQEKLSRLFDGELDESQAHGILNEVAENSEFKALYEEQKTLHSYLQNPYLPEAAGLKEGILEKIKLDSNSIRVYRTRKYILRTAFIGLFLMTLGGYLWLNNNSITVKDINKGAITEINTDHNTDGNDNKVNGTAKRQIPIVKQANLDTRISSTLADQKKTSSSKSKSLTGSKKDYFAHKSDETNIKNKQDAHLGATAAEEAETANRNMLTHSKLFFDTKVARQENNSLSKYYLNPVYDYKTALILDRLSLQFNWYGLSTSSPNFKPTNSKTGILNDFSLFFMYELTEKTSIGVSFGYDNFLMQYDGWEGNTLYRYSQEYSTPWIGCNIKHKFEPILTFADIYDFSPYIQLNTAYAYVGIYTQASAGIEMGISDNTSLLVGFNSGWLFYKYENYEFTNKNGLSIGLKYGF